MLRIVAAQHDPIGMEIVGERAADPQELRVGDDADGDVEPSGGYLFLDPGAHPGVGAHRNGGLGDQDLVGVDDPADRVGHSLECCHVGPAVRGLGGADAQEHDLGVGDACFEVVREHKVAAFGLIGDHRVEAGLEEGSAAAAEDLEFVRVGLDGGHLVADQRKRAGHHGADVAAAYDTDVAVQGRPPGEMKMHRHRRRLARVDCKRPVATGDALA